MTVRRIITGHDADGKAVIAADEAIEGRGLAEDAGRSDATFFQLWATHEMPVDLTDAALARQREGSQTTILGTGSGTVLRIGVLEPGARSPMHRTESLDYGICLEGECDMETRRRRGGDRPRRAMSSSSEAPTTSGTTAATFRAASRGSSSTRSP